jgi:hypothetical protein
VPKRTRLTEELRRLLVLFRDLSRDIASCLAGALRRPSAARPPGVLPRFPA